MKLINGWLKDQMKKATEEVKEWPDWLKKLDEMDTEIENGYKKNEKIF